MRNEQWTRRRFLGSLAAASVGAWMLGGVTSCRGNRGNYSHITGQLLGPDHQSGHRLRDMGALPPSTETRQCGVLIVGGGIAGLAAAWQLRQRGFHDFLLVDLEPVAGGNARGGSMGGMAHPWGAHYLPVPDTQYVPLARFLEQAGVIKGYDGAQRPYFNEEYLCHAPHERLQLHGIWQPSLVPHTGVPVEEQGEIHRFFEEMEAWKVRTGKDGLPAFAIPIAFSSQDPELLALDRMTMAGWLSANRFGSPALRWYVDYCLRDDYGLGIEESSAWAGLHYFAARRGGGANAESGSVLTWPEGNAWLADRLRGKLDEGKGWQGRTLVMHMRQDGSGVEALALDLGKGGKAVTIRAWAAIFAGPQFVARRVVEGIAGRPGALSYAPWLVANLRVNLKGHRLLDGMAWDNVPYGRASLGYVYAGQQVLRQHPAAEGVVTWYEPLSGLQPAEARRWLLAQDYEGLRDRVMDDMEYMHKGISAQVLGLDVWRWGHGMVRPVPGLLSGPELKGLGAPLGRIHFAHSDLSGMSIFEEAFYQGVTSADAVLQSMES